MADSLIETPVALFIHKRHNKLKRVLNALRDIRLPKLYVIGDGAASSEEEQAVRETRSMIDEFDANIPVETNYADENLGLETRIPTGLDWVFEYEAQTIVLEDDCIPDPSFFRFCDQLLDRYRDHSRIMSITGTRYVSDPDLDYSYYVSQFMDPWGWATWSDAWEHYEHNLTGWSEIRESGWLFERFDESSDAWSWVERFDHLVDGTLNTWDYRWLFHCWRHAGLHLAPDRNLITNIGFDEEATHTFDQDSSMANLKRYRMEFPLAHPPWMMRDIRRDHIRQRKKFNRRGWLKRRFHELQRFLTGP